MSSCLNMEKLKIIFPDKILSESIPEFGLYSGEKISIYKKNITPYLILHYNKTTKETTHIDSMLHPVTEEMAIQTFKERFK